MKIKTVLVTGGAGYVGAQLVPKLLKAGYIVRVLDLYLYGKNVLKKHMRLQETVGDIRNAQTVSQALGGVDGVIHLACISNDPSFDLDPKLGKSINYDATIQLIDLAKKARVKRFVYASSSSVYGVKDEANVTEKLSLEPRAGYSKYKALCEVYLLKRIAADFTPLILRPATICGYSPRMRLDLVANILTINALVRKKILVLGGSQKRPNIHIDDMTDLYVKTLEYPDKKIAGKIYNAGHENHTLKDIARMVVDVLGDPSIQIEILQSDDLRSYHINSDKIRRELGFVPKRTIQDAILSIKNAYEKGLLPNALENPRFYNIKTMKAALSFLSD